MEPRVKAKKLFNAVVVLAMSGAYTMACSSSSTPTPTGSSGTTPTDSGAKDGAVTPDDGGGADDAGSDAFHGWAPCG